MKALNDLQVFIEASRMGSFSKVANSMGITPAAVSAAIKRLEEQVGFPLFIRSTRHLRLTNEGEIFCDKASMAVNILQDGLDQIANDRNAFSGKLHITAPSDFGRNLLLTWISEFQEIYSDITIKLELSDKVADIYSQPVDIAIRYGQPADSNLVAISLCQLNEGITCATPEYIAANPTITEPMDLLAHNCLCFMVADTLYNKWQFSCDNRSEIVHVSGNMTGNDSDMIHRLALKGKGIIHTSLMDLSEDIIAGRLVPIFPQWRGFSAPLYMVCADRRLLNPTIRKFQEFIKEKCCQQRKRVLTALGNEQVTD
ncbi:LysR family transcriptional regulator [Photobacterium damselae]|uniref:LysR family transcriptional regulator n=1 Tax=Photobacterium damselae TaxID=38293 RepID=UPI000E077240|nr:LysR family transcriptional regulator [Photobacterium damselae]SUB66847.1 D-malate degradation protein R [Photobacterium damselae]